MEQNHKNEYFSCANFWKEREPEDPCFAADHTLAKSTVYSFGWQIVGASVRGKSHAHTAKYREDCFAFTGVSRSSNTNWWVISVTDGLGSAEYARLGSKIVSKSAVEAIQFSAYRGTLCEHPWEAVFQAVKYALWRVENAASEYDLATKDLATTLLLLLFVSERGKSSCTTYSFQVGDGLICSVNNDGILGPLSEMDVGAYAGLTKTIVNTAMHEEFPKRVRSRKFAQTPSAFVVMTDGVADDLFPYDKNGPILMKFLGQLVTSPTPDERLIQILGYERQGSFDDRTLVVALPTKVQQERSKITKDSLQAKDCHEG